jgi:membrane protease YdiL (CAAX protease family)
MTGNPEVRFLTKHVDLGRLDSLRDRIAGIAARISCSNRDRKVYLRRMANDLIEPQNKLRALPRFRYLIDIVVLTAVTFLLDVIASAFIRAPTSLQRELFVFDAIGKMLLVGVAWGLIRLRGETLGDVGLKRPASWVRTFMIGIGLAAIVFIAMYLSEKAGFRRDLSKFKDVQGNLELTLFGVFYAFIGAGFYEEFMFRGFLMQGLAMFFGASRGAWIAACIVQGILFGAAHAYQNPLGIAITGTLGVLMGLLVLASGRNLWPVIIGHGLFDASRFVLFYFQGPPTG